MIWIVAAALVAICLAALAPAALRPRAGNARAEVEVYRAQLREVERDRARGLVPEAEAEAVRAEVARRLLAADREGEAAARPGPARIGLAVAAACVVAAGIGTYALIGAPGYGDLPLATRIAAVEEARAGRPRQAEAEAAVPDRIDEGAETAPMVAQLREVLAGRPDDLRGHDLLARHAAAIGDFEAAWRAQSRVVALRAAEATADDHAALAELMILAADGYVSPEAERALGAAGRLDPSHGLGRYYAGLMYAQQGRPDLAWPIWRGLLATSEPGAPWIEPILAQIERVSQLAGDPTPLDELPRPVGPSEADIAAAGQLSLEDRVDMIAGMVDGLAGRLATEGGTAEDWARLITSYGVLTRRDAAAAVHAEARQVFADDPAALDLLSRAAERAGLAP